MWLLQTKTVGYGLNSIVPALLLCFPIYLIGKLLEKKLAPRKNVKQFFLWISLVIISVIIYFYAAWYIYMLI